MRRDSHETADDAAERLAEARQDRYELTYVAVEGDHTVLVTKQFDTIGEGRDALRTLGPNAEGDLAELSWNPKRSKFDHRSLMGNDRVMSADERTDLRRRGLSALRSVTAHHGGFDTRAGEVDDKGLDSRGHDHKPGRTCKVCERGQLEHVDSAECSTCDYLMEHGIEPVHPLRGTTKTLEAPERF